MELIDPLVELLERDDALELENHEQTYGDDFEPVAVDWDRLFPAKARLERDGEDWDLYGDPWRPEWPDDFLDDIVKRAQSADFPSDEPEDIFPEDVLRQGRYIWDVCAWYQPIHYFGYDWGIYIREDCLLNHARAIAARFRLGRRVILNPGTLAKALFRASFASFFLHEQFHHKVESLGFRAHVMLGRSAYLPYKKAIYRPHYMTDDCLEEALANASAYLRLSTDPYKSAMGRSVCESAKSHLKASFPKEPPGYRLASIYLTESLFQNGANLLQGQFKEARLSPIQPVTDWTAAKQLLRSYFSIRSNIFTVVRRGARPILPVNVVPKSCATQDMVRIYESMGYRIVPGGKGSHVKLKKDGAPTMILPGNRRELSPGVLSAALKALGDYSIQDLEGLIRAA